MIIYISLMIIDGLCCLMLLDDHVQLAQVLKGLNCSNSEWRVNESFCILNCMSWLYFAASGCSQRAKKMGWKLMILVQLGCQRCQEVPRKRQTTSQSSFWTTGCQGVGNYASLHLRFSELCSSRKLYNIYIIMIDLYINISWLIYLYI
jgi:hypothetical protein